MKKLIYMLCFLGLMNVAKAEYSSVISLKVSVVGQPTQTENRISFGVIEPGATDAIDTALGEREYPPFPPPMGVFYTFLEWKDVKQNEYVWTLKQYRPYMPLDTFVLRYSYGEGTEVKIEWGNLPANIDSAYIQDNYDGSVVKADMKKQKEVTIKGDIITEVAIIVWFSKPIGVTDDIAKNGLLYPNPFENLINIANIELFDEVVFTNLLGMETKVKSGAKSVDVSSMPPGMYLIKVMKEGKLLNMQKMIKK